MARIWQFPATTLSPATAAGVLCGIIPKCPLPGGSYLNVFFVADTKVEGGFSSEKISIFLRKDGVNILFPMKGDKHFRVLGILPVEYYHRKNLPFEEILDQLKKGMAVPADFHDINWHSTYKLHHKKVDRFSQDNIFFVGDAAHVHSPVGGQGMNTGLQDAYNLAWKLALVVQGKASTSLLSSYHQERNPVAETLLKTTDKMFQFMSRDRFWDRVFRLNLIPLLVPLVTRSRTIRRMMFRMVSQIKVNYKGSSLSKGRIVKIAAGERLPYFSLFQEGRSVSIYELLRKQPAPFTWILFNQAETDLPSGPNDLFNKLILENNPDNEKALVQVGLPKLFAILVRPDNYIAYASDRLVKASIFDFLANNYGFPMLDDIPHQGLVNR